MSAIPKGSIALENRIGDPEVAVLAGIAGMLQGDYLRPEVERQWAGSPFAWIRTQPSRRVGKIGEQLVSGWCAAKGFDVQATGDPQADRIISGQRVEIKFSTLWENGSYTFQQVRNQNYAQVVCLGVSPLAAHCWAIPKDVVRANIAPQHGGRQGTDTLWFSVDPNEPHSWLRPFGGTLQQVFRVIRSW